MNNTDLQSYKDENGTVFYTVIENRLHIKGIIVSYKNSGNAALLLGIMDDIAYEMKLSEIIVDELFIKNERELYKQFSQNVKHEKSKSKNNMFMK